MAVGDAVQGLASVSAGAYLVLQPGANVEWIIHNIYWAGATTLEVYNGTNSVIFNTDTAAGAYLGMVSHCTNSIYIRVKNTTAGAFYCAYDGVQTK
jgi:hypothetical protein